MPKGAVGKEASTMHTKKMTANLEIKSLDEGGHFEGYASVFGVQDYDRYGS